jgi:hypothetical protein
VGRRQPPGHLSAREIYPVHRVNRNFSASIEAENR